MKRAPEGEDVGLDGAAGGTVVEGAGDAPGSSPRTVGAHDEGRGRRLGLCAYLKHEKFK